MSRRLALQEAFERLCVYQLGPVACARLEAALQENRARLYCDGTLQSPGDIKSQLRLIPEPEADGRWRIRVAPAGPLGFARCDYRWEVDGVEKLLPYSPSGPGRKSRDNWTGIVRHELDGLWRKGSPLFKNQDQLKLHLRNHLVDEIGWAPENLKPLNKLIQTFLEGHN